jgi:tetratricopeptide (TPR) repeat protein
MLSLDPIQAEAVAVESRELAAAEALARSPNDPEHLFEFARAALARGDWEAAIRRWQIAEERFPGSWQSPQGAALALQGMGRLDDAEAVLQVAIERFPDEPEPLFDLARLAEVRGDWEEAIRRWRVARARFPERWQCPLGEALGLRVLGRLDEAEAVLRAATQNFSDQSEPLFDYARVAEARGDWAEAIRRWRVAGERPPCLLGEAACLRALGRLDDAEAVLTAAMERFPSEPGPLFDHAKIAEARGDWTEAVRRWRAVGERFAERWEPPLGEALGLRALGRFDDAEAVLAAAMQRFPNEPEPLFDHARIAGERGAWDEAARRWEDALRRYPQRLSAVIGRAGVLIETRQLEAAEALLRRAIDEFAPDPGAWSAYAEVAMRRLDWREAMVRWEEAQRLFPTERQFAHRIFEIQMRLIETEDAAPAVADLTKAPAGDDGIRRLLLRFESLGGLHLGCEFGLVQRHFGIEPLGLLRWTALSPDELVAALDANLAEVGRPEFTEMMVEDGEYITRDVRFGLRMHTFVGAGAMQRDRMFAQVCRRLEFLRDKLLDDLRGGEKIFVYKIEERTLRDDEIKSIYAALRNFGNNYLLYVGYADERHAAGMVRIVEDDIFVGYVDHFGYARTGEKLPLAIADWVAVCRRTDELVAAARALRPAPEEDMSRLMLGFESLGGVLHGCEFGTIQREFGAEPLGLLRWCDITPEQLIAALHARFEGVGSPENTLLEVSHNGEYDEYVTRDTRFGMVMHTFVRADTIPYETMFDQACRRLMFLRDKLCADLQEAQKIFVYKITLRTLGNDEIMSLHEALKTFGHPTLLYVAEENLANPNGTARWFNDDVLISYIDHFASTRPDGRLSGAVSSWSAICQTARARLLEKHAAVVTNKI